ncbi:hypothetical protein PP935_gp212 [Rhizobium phage RHph_N34]|uniref:Uncharacterized protein n=1 Tax=Rhizobium phage RHph_N34 TaxID=2509586 RepID=A0A7S5RAL6_9CAUD|nr:hypothetical protein PP935_gp212 [Rhizobium phage RHph_N34]QIG73987.1 hypothetical protein EVC06_212 [Rhizobium phage RHph_N34]
MPTQVIKWRDNYGTEFDTYDEADESNRINKPLEFKDVRVPGSVDISDISSEEFRIYEFLLEGLKEPQYVIIENPIALHVRESGSHVVVNSLGETTYVPTGWLHLTWRAKEGEDHISF